MRPFAGLFVASLSLLASSAFGAPPGANIAADEPDEIFITAQKRSETLDKTGAAVSVIDAARIRESGLSGTDRLAEQFPALTVQPTSTGNLIFVRGVGNFTLQPNSDPAVGFAYDGVFLARPIGTQLPFFDLDRIELLKGPQGVLYGRNASAGSINLEPRQPVFSASSGFLQTSFDSEGSVASEAAVNVSFGGDLAFRISGTWSDRASYLKGYKEGPEPLALRTQLKARLSSKTTLRISGDYSALGGTGLGSAYQGNYVYRPLEQRYEFIDAGLPNGNGIYSSASQAYRQTIFLPLAGRNLDELLARPQQEHRLSGIHARLESDLGFAQLVLIPAWRRSVIDATVSGPPFGLDQYEAHEQYSLEARLTGRSGPVDWLLGSHLFDDKLTADTTTNLSSSLIFSNQRFDTRSIAGFMNLTWNVLPRLRLQGGLRWTRDRKTFSSETQSASIICLTRIANRPSCPNVPLFQIVDNFGEAPFPIPALSGERLPILIGGLPTGAVVSRSNRFFDGRLKDTALTWRAGGEFDLASRTLIFALAETGYRPGGLNAAVGFEKYDPEKITAFTLGLRHRSADQRLGLALEFFHWDYREQQVSALRPDLANPPINSNITQTIGHSRIRGLETEITFRPWKNTQLRTVVQFLDSDYKSFEYFQANTNVPPLTGCEATLDATTNLYLIDCRAKQPYNSPKWSLDLDARHTIEIGRVTLTGILDTHFRSARNIGFAFLDEQRVSANWTTNAQVILGIPRHRISVAGIVQNIEGSRVPQFSIFHPVSNALIVSASPPRRFGLRISKEF